MLAKSLRNVAVVVVVSGEEDAWDSNGGGGNLSFKFYVALLLIMRCPNKDLDHLCSLSPGQVHLATLQLLCLAFRALACLLSDTSNKLLRTVS